MALVQCFKGVITFLIIGFLCCRQNALAQDIDALLKLHKQNLTELYKVRGTPKEWAQSGKVTDRDLRQTLYEYNGKVLLVLYSHVDDTLITSTITYNGHQKSWKTRITKDSLIQLIHNANQSFFNSPDVASLNRGGKSSSTSLESSGSSFFKMVDLLFPYAESIKEFEHLIIVPALNIATIPFSAFPVTDSTRLIDHLSYSIAPSVLELMVSKTINDQEVGAGMVQFEFDNALLVSNPTYPKIDGHHFENLPGADKEIEAIQQIIKPENCTILSGNDAVKRRVRDSFCTADLLYFATHGIASSEDPMDKSFLVLANEGDSSGLFTAREIHNSRYNCKLRADLVVLSACQTGLGMEHAGGVIGLARAFQIAGANHVVMSLWNIDDQATVDLMKLFFIHLGNASPYQPHEALRQAILEYKSDINSNPQNWAAFSIFGVPYTVGE